LEKVAKFTAEIAETAEEARGIEISGCLAGEGAIYSMKAFGIVPRFVGKTLSGKKAFIALGLTAGNKRASRISQSSDNGNGSTGSLS